MFSFIGGIVKYARETSIIMASTFNSYKAYTKEKEAPISRGWGVRNRSSMIRIPIATEPKNMRIELRSPDPAGNAYLQIAVFIANELGSHVPWHISAFSGSISWKLRDINDTSVEKLKEIYLIGKQEGLEHVYLGNVSTKLGENTQCPNCGNLVIKRRAFQVESKIKGGTCSRCKKKIEGFY